MFLCQVNWYTLFFQGDFYYKISMVTKIHHEPEYKESQDL